MPRHQKLPVLKFPEWKCDKNRYSIDADVLRAKIVGSGLSEEIVRSRMGFGYEHIETLLRGGSIDIWAANIVEYGISNEVRVGNLPIKY